MASKVPSWQLSGVVVSKQELKSSKNPSSAWRKYLARVAAMGGTFDVECPVEMYNSVGSGQELAFSGIFEIFGQKVSLVATKCEAAK